MFRTAILAEQKNYIEPVNPDYMSTFWKLSTFLLLIVCLILTFMLVRDNPVIPSNGTLSLQELTPNHAEKNKQQNPIFAPDNNDFFFQNPTEIIFLQNEYDFDTIVADQVIKRTIKYINTGKNPYFITDIKVSCGCTVPSYDNRPIPPGDTGLVDVEYNSARKNGFNMNKLSLFGNTKPTEKSVYFKIFVKGKKH